MTFMVMIDSSGSVSVDGRSLSAHLKNLEKNREKHGIYVIEVKSALSHSSKQRGFYFLRLDYLCENGDSKETWHERIKEKIGWGRYLIDPETGEEVFVSRSLTEMNSSDLNRAVEAQDEYAMDLGITLPTAEQAGVGRKGKRE